jgi:hypothetical protein
MKKIDRIRAREAARVCLIESRKMLETARNKLLEVSPGNLRLREDFGFILDRYDRVLFLVVDDQSEEK